MLSAAAKPGIRPTSFYQHVNGLAREWRRRVNKTIQREDGEDMVLFFKEKIQVQQTPKDYPFEKKATVEGDVLKSLQ